MLVRRCVAGGMGTYRPADKLRLRSGRLRMDSGLLTDVLPGGPAIAVPQGMPLLRTGSSARRTSRLLVLSAVFLLACSGNVKDATLPSAMPPNGKADEPSAPVNLPADDQGLLPTDACGSQLVPGPAQLRRLTNLELAGTLSSLFAGMPLPALDLIVDPSIDGFRNNAKALTVSTLHARRYSDVAAAVAVAATKAPAVLLAVGGCAPTTSACLKPFVDRFARRAFRRPPSAVESSALLALASQRGGLDGISDVIQAVLQSPSFLYRQDRGTPDAKTKLIKLDGYSMASRLSFWLWGGPPDDELLDAAASGALDSVEGVAARASMMLKKPNAAVAFSDFAHQWLRLSALDEVKVDEARYPAFDSNLKKSMIKEVDLLLSEFLQPGADVGKLFSARHSNVNAALGTSIYGMEIKSAVKQGLKADEFSRVDFSDDSRRGGLLSLPGILAAHGRDEKVWPILRGKFISESVLCSPPPPPPDNIPALPQAKQGESLRDQLARHRTDAACKGCHEGLEPVGFGLEQFDLLGRFRATDAQGLPLTGSGELPGFTPAKFDGARELGERLQTSPRTSACFARQVFRYAFGRQELEKDACTLNSLTKAFIAGNRDVGALVQDLVKSPSFRFAAQESQ